MPLISCCDHVVLCNSRCWLYGAQTSHLITHQHMYALLVVLYKCLDSVGVILAAMVVVVVVIGPCLRGHLYVQWCAVGLQRSFSMQQCKSVE